MEPTHNKETPLLQQLAELKDSLEQESADSSLLEYSCGVESEWVSCRNGLRLTGETEAQLWGTIETLIEDCRLCCSAPSAPIVAILGLLNAGKSSLVSTYLSDEGRARVLVGSSNHEGTHRFVLWLPNAWRNSSIWQNMESRLSAIFGHAPELLSEDSATAMRQYNDTTPRTVSSETAENGVVNVADQAQRVLSTIEIPLVAFDTGLDRWGIALMDCPDVQTGFLPSEQRGSQSAVLQSDRLAQAADFIAQQRLDVLARAAPICSSFVIVLPANAMHDQKVSQLMRLLRERMPYTHQIAAVNRVPRRYECAMIREELLKLYGNENLYRFYMAYGYDGPQQRERLPTPKPEWNLREDTLLPLFFRMDQPAPKQPPAMIQDQDWLLNLGSQLDFESLLQDLIRSHISRLQSETTSAISILKKQSDSNLQARRAMRESLANACLQFSLDPAATDSVRMQASKKIIEQISKSLERTAPWWAMPGRWTARLAEYGKASVGQLGQWFKLPAWLSDKTEGLVQFVRTRWRSGDAARVVTAESLVDAIQRLDRTGVWGLDGPHAGQPCNVRSQLVPIVQRAIDRFQEESTIELEEQELDQVTAKMWEQMPWTKRLATGFAPAAVLFAPLVAVMLLPFDFGGSSVLVFASLKELLGAGVASLGLALLSPDRMPKIAESEAAWQQLGDLVASMCDALDLERPSKDNPMVVTLGHEQRNIASSGLRLVSARRSPKDPLSPAFVPRKMHLRQPQLSRLENLLQTLST